MIRKSAQFHASLVWLFDMAVVAASFGIAHVLRFDVFSAPEVSRETSLQMLAVILVTFSVVFRWSGLYLSRRLSSRTDEIFGLFKGVALSVLIVVTATYFLRESRYSRLTLIFFAVVCFTLLSSTRTLARKFLAELRRKGFNRRRALVVGDGQLAKTVLERLGRRPEYGIHVVGVVGATAAGNGKEERSHAGVPLLGTYEDLETIVDAQHIEQVYLALPLSEHDRLLDLLHGLSHTTADVKVVPDLFQHMSLHGGVEEVDGMPIVALSHGPVHGWDAVAKRAFDLVFGGLILLGAAPVMLVVAAAIKLTSRGPVFYSQERMGLDGRCFHILKFRSMRVDAEKDGARWAKSGDDRTTPIGAFLRKYSLDELPQFINVLRGEMSLVGPRPERPVFIEDFKRKIPNYQQRHKVKAGITGLAQVEGWRGQTSLEKRIERDLYYVQNWSLWLDFKILVRTALGGFLSKNAY